MIDLAVSDAVADLLERSRTAYQQKRMAPGRQMRGMVVTPRTYVRSEQCIAEALRLRNEAEAMDPDHLSPAWLDDQALNAGVSHREWVVLFHQYLTTPMWTVDDAA